MIIDDVNAANGSIIKTGEEILAERLEKVEEALQLQGQINLKLIQTMKDLQERIENLDGIEQKASPLILPPRLQ